MKKINLISFITIIVIVFFANNFVFAKKFLFDAKHYQTAGNADWVIDEDNNVPARFPTPLQSTITSSTPETYWTGAISSWGISLVKLGHTVESLPISASITFGNSSNPQDLSNYDVFIVDEPNSPFTLAEKNAIISFVNSGGGLFMISDHVGADRNNDGWDAVAVWDDLLRNNSTQQYVFGFKLDSLNFSETTSNINSNSAGDVILNGPEGSVTQLKFSNGTSITMMPTINPNVKGLIWRSTSSQGNNNVMCVSSTYGSGRIVAIGDSSPADDGTGSAGHTLYSSWLGEVNGNHARLHMNASLWLAKVTGLTFTNENTTIPLNFSLKQNYPNPFNPSSKIKFSIPSTSFPMLTTLKIYNILGNEVSTLVNEPLNSGNYEIEWNASSFGSGTYFYKLTSSNFTDTKKMTLIK